MNSIKARARLSFYTLSTRIWPNVAGTRKGSLAIVGPFFGKFLFIYDLGITYQKIAGNFMLGEFSDFSVFP